LDEIMGTQFILSTKTVPDVVSNLQQDWSNTGIVEIPMESMFLFVWQCSLKDCIKMNKNWIDYMKTAGRHAFLHIEGKQYDSIMG